MKVNLPTEGNPAIEMMFMPGTRAVFRGRLSELLAKVDSGEFIPKLQASHAPPCKFWTAFSVINGIRHVVPLIHNPTGRTYLVASDFKLLSHTGC